LKHLAGAGARRERACVRVRAPSESREHVRMRAASKQAAALASKADLGLEVCRKDAIICAKAAHEFVELGVVGIVLGEEIHAIRIAASRPGVEGCWPSLANEMSEQADALELLNDVATKRVLERCMHRCGSVCSCASTCRQHACTQRRAGTPKRISGSAQATLIRRYIRPRLQQFCEQIIEEERSMLESDRLQIKELGDRARAEVGRVHEALQQQEQAAEVARYDFERLRDASRDDFARLRLKFEVEWKVGERRRVELKDQAWRSRSCARAARLALCGAQCMMELSRHFGAWSQQVFRACKRRWDLRARELSVKLSHRNVLCDRVGRVLLQRTAACGSVCVRFGLCGAVLDGWRDYTAALQRERHAAGLRLLRTRCAAAEAGLARTSTALRQIEACAAKDTRKLRLSLSLHCWLAARAATKSKHSEDQWRSCVFRRDELSFRRYLLRSSLKTWRMHCDVAGTARNLDIMSGQLAGWQRRDTEQRSIRLRRAFRSMEEHDALTQQYALVHWLKEAKQRWIQRTSASVHTTMESRVTAAFHHAEVARAMGSVYVCLFRWRCFCRHRERLAHCAAYVLSRSKALHSRWQCMAVGHCFFLWRCLVAHARDSQSAAQLSGKLRLAARTCVVRVEDYSQGWSASVSFKAWRRCACNTAQHRRWMLASSELHDLSTRLELVAMFACWRLSREEQESRMRKRHGAYVSRATAVVRSLAARLELCRIVGAWRAAGLSAQAQRRWNDVAREKQALETRSQTHRYAAASVVAGMLSRRLRLASAGRALEAWWRQAVEVRQAQAQVLSHSRLRSRAESVTMNLASQGQANFRRGVFRAWYDASKMCGQTRRCVLLQDDLERIKQEVAELRSRDRATTSQQVKRPADLIIIRRTRLLVATVSLHAWHRVTGDAQLARDVQRWPLAIVRQRGVADPTKRRSRRPTSQRPHSAGATRSRGTSLGDAEFSTTSSGEQATSTMGATEASRVRGGSRSGLKCCFADWPALRDQVRRAFRVPQEASVALESELRALLRCCRARTRSVVGCLLSRMSVSTVMIHFIAWRAATDHAKESARSAESLQAGKLSADLKCNAARRFISRRTAASVEEGCWLPLRVLFLVWRRDVGTCRQLRALLRHYRARTPLVVGCLLSRISVSTVMSHFVAWRAAVDHTKESARSAESLQAGKLSADWKCDVARRCFGKCMAATVEEGCWLRLRVCFLAWHRDVSTFRQLLRLAPRSPARVSEDFADYRSLCGRMSVQIAQRHETLRRQAEKAAMLRRKMSAVAVQRVFLLCLCFAASSRRQSHKSLQLAARYVGKVSDDALLLGFRLWHFIAASRRAADRHMSERDGLAAQFQAHCGKVRTVVENGAGTVSALLLRASFAAVRGYACHHKALHRALSAALLIHLRIMMQFVFIAWHARVLNTCRSWPEHSGKPRQCSSGWSAVLQQRLASIDSAVAALLCQKTLLGWLATLPDCQGLRSARDRVWCGIESLQAAGKYRNRTAQRRCKLAHGQLPLGVQVVNRMHRLICQQKLRDRFDSWRLRVVQSKLVCSESRYHAEVAHSSGLFKSHVSTRRRGVFSCHRRAVCNAVAAGIRRDDYSRLSLHFYVWFTLVSQEVAQQAALERCASLAQHQRAVRSAVAAGIDRDVFAVLGMLFYLWSSLALPRHFDGAMTTSVATSEAAIMTCDCTSSLVEVSMVVDCTDAAVMACVPTLNVDVMTDKRTADVVDATVMTSICTSDVAVMAEERPPCSVSDAAVMAIADTMNVATMARVPMSDAAILINPTRSDATSMTHALPGRTDVATNTSPAEHKTVAVAASLEDLHAPCKQSSTNCAPSVPMDADWSLRARTLLRAWAELGDMHPLGKQQQVAFRRASAALLGGRFLAVAHAFALWRVWTTLWLSSSAHNRDGAGYAGGASANPVTNPWERCSPSRTRTPERVPEVVHMAHAPPVPEFSWSSSPLSTPSRFLPRHSYQASSSPALLKMPARVCPTPQSCSGPLPPPPGGRFGSPKTPSTAATVHAEHCSFLSQGACPPPLSMRSFAGDDVAKLHSDASLLRLECSALAERHWLLCSEVSCAADEMREHLRVAARASSDKRLALDQATRIGLWFLNVSDRLKNLTSFLHKEDFQHLGSRTSVPYLSFARICSPA